MDVLRYAHSGHPRRTGKKRRKGRGILGSRKLAHAKMHTVKVGHSSAGPL
jgi:hypothetical protein